MNKPHRKDIPGPDHIEAMGGGFGSKDPNPDPKVGMEWYTDQPKEEEAKPEPEDNSQETNG